MNVSKRQRTLTEKFIPRSSILCAEVAKVLLQINEEQVPERVRILVDSLSEVIKTHIATCNSCLNLASVIDEANQLQPL